MKALKDNKLNFKYNVNFLWLNKKFDKNMAYLFPKVYKRGDQEIDLEKRLKEWADLNPSGKVCFWFDSETLSLEAIKNTKKLFKGYNNIKLCDIRDIPVVSSNPVIFSTKSPLYFKIDLLKLVICLHSLENMKNKHTVFTDLQLPILKEKKLFSKKYQEKLNKLGFMNNGDENQFLQMQKSDTLLEALKIVINSNISNFSGVFLYNKLHKKKSIELGFYFSKLYNSVFFSTLNFIKAYIIYKKNNKKITVNEKRLGISTNNSVDYNYKTHGHKPFGNLYLEDYMDYYYISNSGLLYQTNDIISLSLNGDIMQNYGDNDNRDDIEPSGCVHKDTSDLSEIKSLNFTTWEDSKKIKNNKKHKL